MPPLNKVTSPLRYVALNNRTVTVIGVQEALCRGGGRASDQPLQLGTLNQLLTVGDARRLLVAPNAQHVVVVQSFRKSAAGSPVGRLPSLAKLGLPSAQW